MSVFAGLMLPRRSQPKPPRRQTWDPPALQWWNLSLLVLICWAFIALLQYFLTKSQNDGGIIFAPNVNDLPLRRSFAYLYLPTIAAVIFSIYWAWIDLDAKRFEPYHQLSKPGGALGKDSLLLHYPNEFIPIAPFYALKNRHWLVFWASTATVLTTFGIVPLQAGIFSTQQKVTRIFPQSFTFSSSSDQQAVLGVSYTQSAYGILRLNETLPAFMTNNYTLAPFTALGVDTPLNSTWTANTTLYGLDLECEEARPGLDKNDFPVYNMSTGCDYSPYFAFGNDTVGMKPNVPMYAPDLKTRGFSTLYSGSFARGVTSGGVADNLDYSCPNETEHGTFFAALVRNKAKENEPMQNATAIFCRPSYFEQPVRATVDAVTKSPISTVPLEPRRPLSPALFNNTVFQAVLASGKISKEFNAEIQRQSTLPGSELPRYDDRLAEADLSLVMIIHETTEPDYVHPMAAMALTTSKRSTKENLDARVLKESYETAYRLLFARAMTDVLKPDYALAPRQSAGERQVVTEAVVLEPVFTYLVEAFLGIVSISALALLYMTIVRQRKRILASDPGTIAAAMSLVADDEPLLSSFADIDGGSTKHLEERIRNRRYQLGRDTRSIVEIASPSTTPPNPTDLKTAKPTRPSYFRLFVAIPFTGLFVALAIVGSVLFVKSKPHGLPLPSNNKLTQNIVRAYIPTALATFIEPMWILANRLLCMLQPLQQLRGSRASASKSINLNYSSLPPQLTIFKALRAGHFMLASVCAMALLANLLAVSFAGLLFQDTVAISKPTSYAAPFAAKFVEINGATGPTLDVGEEDSSKANYSGAYQGGTGDSQFLVAESNYTHGAPLPSWTDEYAMYLPLFSSNFTSRTSGETYRAQTKFISADLNCKPIFPNLVMDAKEGMHTETGTERFNPFNITVEGAAGNTAACWSSADVIQGTGFSPLQGRQGSIFWNSRAMALSGRVGGEALTTLHAGVNATKAEQETCMATVVIGWFRLPQNGSEHAHPHNSLFLTCQPQLTIGDATVTVNSKGRILEKVPDRTPDPGQSRDTLDKYFTNGAVNLVGQSSLFLFRSLLSIVHNDTFASENMHYFVNVVANSTRFTDPTEKAPQFEDVEAPLNEAYSKLFAIWLGVNKELLLVPAANSTEQPMISGEIIHMEERLFFKTALFIISEVILGIYTITSILVYLRRPGRYLPRMPTSIAAVIALFAASAAVEDMRGTSQFTTRKREQYLKDSGFRYGYGSFVGGDGHVHVGIEKAPFVRSMQNTTFEHSRFDKDRRKTTTIQVTAVPADSSWKDSWRGMWPRGFYKRARSASPSARPSARPSAPP